MEDHSSNRHQFLNGNYNLAGRYKLYGIKERYCVQANIYHELVFSTIAFVGVYYKASPQLR